VNMIAEWRRDSDARYICYQLQRRRR